MARVKVSEHSIYQLFTEAHLPASLSFSVNSQTTAGRLTALFGKKPLVVKVDQGIKKRGKQGLVQVNLTASEVVAQIKIWVAMGWGNFVVVPYLVHKSSEEHYLSLEIFRDGWHLIWGEQGGVEVESTWGSTNTSILSQADISSCTFPPYLPRLVSLIIPKLIQVMTKSNLVFLECNPLVIKDNAIYPLDLAGLVDNTGSSKLSIVEDKNLTKLEKNVAKLDAATAASLKCKLVNQDGAIWMLLSGGGASLVLADEVADQGMGKILGNYGEYSGSPTTEDTMQYTGYILDALLASSAKSKALIVAGGVANFTDVKSTFKGIIAALSAREATLKEQHVQVFVRRGGPSEAAGLKLMHDYLESAQILGSIHGHETTLTNVVAEVKEFLHA